MLRSNQAPSSCRSVICQTDNRCPTPYPYEEREYAGMTSSDRSWASSPGTRASMRANRSRDTKPEIALRRAVHALGLRYRVAARPLPNLRRTADLVFTQQKVAVFMDGCFWHGCEEHHTRPSANARYWSEKVRRNRERDQDTTARLTEAGWLVLRYWEHEDPVKAALEVEAAVKARRTGGAGGTVSGPVSRA
ncbi:very short patch repair endonuclease [Streptomyces fungicidicus]|uniref:very short patch repair endonuclease n=1 Tax=Streptomyces fungicidicus TaxID=68203 RepID=UPI00384C2FEC